MENVQLTIADLASIRNVIDAACSRGAFKAAEMAQVGEVYNKLTTFLEAVDAAQAAEKAEAEAAAQSQGEQNA
jgi:hypothetical protein